MKVNIFLNAEGFRAVHDDICPDIECNAKILLLTIFYSVNKEIKC